MKSDFFKRKYYNHIESFISLKESFIFIYIEGFISLKESIKIKRSIKYWKWKLNINKWEGVYTWNFILGWNSSRDEIIPAYGEMSLTVYTFLRGWTFIPGWVKEKKTCKHFIPGWNFKMSVFLINFWRMYSNMLSKVNVFEHNQSMNEWNIRPLYKKSEVPKEKEWRQKVKHQNIKTFYSIIFFEEFRKTEIPLCFNLLP